MKHKLSLMLCAFLLTAIGMQAESNYCGYPTSSDADYSLFRKNNKSVVFSWNTADNGDVVVTIAPGDGTTTATFRNAGFEGDITKFTVLSGDGFATEENASKYFEEIAEIGKVSSYTLYRKGGYNLPSPCKIKFTDAAVAWRLNDTNDEYCFPTFTYDYGTLCGSTLDTPTISVNSDGEVSFSAVSGADSYKAYVYEGSQFIKECPVTSGQRVWNPYIAGEYAIYVRAFNSSTNAYSDFSNGVIWNAAGDINGDLPPSSMHNFLMKNGVGTDVYVSMSTDLTTGNVNVTISAIDPANEDYAYWREDGVRTSGLKYNGETFTDYFTCVYGNPVPSQTKTLIYIPKSTGDHIPAYGGVISFKGTTVWNYGNSGNTYRENLQFKDYIYGAGLGTLSRPIISDFTSAGVITFEAVPGATSYKALVYSSDEKQMYEQVVTSGSTINYHPYLTDTYKVYLQALSDDDFSAVSASVDWDLEGNLAYLPQSEWCETIYHTTSNGSEDVNFKWETDPDGNVVITLSPVEGNPQTYPTDFRNTYGMSKNNFMVGDVAASTYFDRETSGAVLTLRLLNPAVKPVYGTTITFDGQVQYQTGTHNNAYPNMHFEYIYGTNCETYNDHVNPIITALSIVSTDYTSVTLHVEATDEDDAGTPQELASYSISSTDHGFVTQMVTPDESGNFMVSGLVSNKTYTFTVHAIDAMGNDGTSDIEVALPFNPNFNLAKNKPCTGGYCQFGDHSPEQNALYYPRANDGDATTSYSAFESPSTDDSWWQVNLEAIYDVTHVDVNWASDYSTGYAIYGSLDGTNWYLIGKDAATAAGVKSTIVVAPAQYVKIHSYNKANIVIREVEVYASGYSTLTDDAPVITWTKVGTIDDSSAEIEIDAVDITTKPITTYMVSGIGGDAQEVIASEGKITLTSLSQSTHYTLSIQAKDESGNLSAAEEVEFTTTGSVSGLYLHSDLYGWDLADSREQFSTTAVPDVLSFTHSFSANTNHTYKLYNADAARCTSGNCSGTTDHLFRLTSATDVTFYATDEDHFLSTIDTLFLHGALVGDDQALEWNEDHTVAIWTGAIDLSGTKQFNLIKKHRINGTLHTYTHDFYASAQTFSGDYTYGTFTLDLTKMTGTWSYVGLSFADNATDNSDIIAANADRIANVTLNRSILADNSWYTLCLPFDMSAEKVTEVFGNSTIAELKSSEDRGSLIHLNFDYVNATEAGHAYLIMPGQDFVAGTVIEGVTIKNVDPETVKSACTHMYYQGTYDKITLTESNQRFVSDNNYLYSPNSVNGSPVGAFRCYFTIRDDAPVSAMAKRAQIVFAPQTTTGLESIQPSEISIQKVLRDGQLFIIRDGKTYNAQGVLVKSE